MPKRDHLGEAEQKILLSLWRLEGEAHGARVQAELEAVAGRSMSVSAIHVTLLRLQEKGLVRSWLGSPTPERGGKARRIFRLEPAGVEALRASRETMNRLWDGLDEAPGQASS